MCSFFIVNQSCSLFALCIVPPSTSERFENGQKVPGCPVYKCTNCAVATFRSLCSCSLYESLDCC
jgi:hypothetical protein